MVQLTKQMKEAAIHPCLNLGGVDLHLVGSFWFYLEDYRTQLRFYLFPLIFEFFVNLLYVGVLSCKLLFERIPEDDYGKRNCGT